MVSSDQAQNSSESLAQVQQLLYLGKLPTAIHQAQMLLASPTVASQSQILLIRCLMLQGRYREAVEVCQKALEAPSVDEQEVRELRLWNAFLQIYTLGDPTLAITEGRSTLQWVQAQAQNPRLLARVQVLLGKALAIANTWGLLPAIVMQEARNLLLAASQGYRDAGYKDDSLSALLSLGQLYTMGADANQNKAREYYQEVYDLAQASANGVRRADAALRLAELDFDSQIEKQDQTTGGFDLSPFQHALDLYNQADYALGPADVWLSLGGRMVDSGFDGAGALQNALTLYLREDNLLGVYSAQRSLSTWYLKQGNLAQARAYHEQSAAIAGEMEFPAGQATCYLGLGDYFFRSGDFARALAYCEQAEQLVKQPAVSATVGLSLANIYTQMHLPDRAEQSCRSAITALAPAGPSSRLSLARFILGNVLSSRGDWAGAIVAWREGVVEDERIQDRASQAEKLQCIAQATVMQYYRPSGLPVPEAAYDEAMSLFAQSLSLLQGRKDPQALAIIANTYQLQGQIAFTCGRLSEAPHYLEQAANIYAALRMDMHTAITNTLIGLLDYDLGNRGQTELYAEAAHRYEQALDYFQRVQMRDMSWRVRFHLSLISFHRGRLALTADEQQKLWLAAANYLEEASNDIELVRGRFVAANPLTTQLAQLGLVSDKENVYSIAIRLYYRYLHDKESAFRWLERLKGRTFLDALALTDLRPPSLLDKAILQSENELLEAFHTAISQATAIELNEKLHVLWNQMATNPAATEYVALRRGRTADWDDIIALIRPEKEVQK